jgi:hypothetical protein
MPEMLTADTALIEADPLSTTAEVGYDPSPRYPSPTMGVLTELVTAGIL